eukprot:11039556-Heterocapsa_arctica.AAC.1
MAKGELVGARGMGREAGGSRPAPRSGGKNHLQACQPAGKHLVRWPVAQPNTLVSWLEHQLSCRLDQSNK